MKRQQRTWKVISAGILVVLWIGFIFANSLQTGENSGALSGTIVELIIESLPQLTSWFTIDQLHFFLRKLAHFSEYAILGMWLWIFWLQVTKNQVRQLSRAKYQAQTSRMLWSKKEYRTIISQTMTISLLSGLLVALSDETIQTFIPARSGQVTDVWIDFMGIITAQIVLASICYIMNKRKLVGK